MALACCALVPAHASAYRTVADQLALPPPVVRAGLVLPVMVEREPVGAITGDQLAGAADTAAAAWRAECSPLRFEVMEMSAGYADEADGLTSIVVVGAGWLERGYRSSQAAVTEARYVRVGEDWMIADADILVNGDTFDWSAADAPSLTAVLVHELGHALGLAHPCEFGGVAGEPECGTMPEIASIAVMYPRYQDGAVTLRSDDVAGLCALYPGDACAGVACGRDEMCVDGVCRPALICPAGDVCAGGVCATGGSEPGTRAAPGTLGAPCTMGEECSSRLCLTSMRHGSYCTRTCTFDDECGVGEACTHVDDTLVCAPRQSSGCAASPPRRLGRWLPAAALVLIPFLLGRRRR